MAVGRSSEVLFAMILAAQRMPPAFATDESADVEVCRWQKWSYGFLVKALYFGCTQELIPDTYKPDACPDPEEL